MFVDARELWFSAYGFGRGYAAYALAARTVLDQLVGCRKCIATQMKLAFALGEPRIRRAVEMSNRPHAGERKALPEVPA